MDFHEIFRIGLLWCKEQSGIFWDVATNPLETRVIFSGPMIVGNGVWISMKLSRYGHKEQVDRLSHAQLDCFTLPKLAVTVPLFAECPVRRNLCQTDYSWKSTNYNPYEIIPINPDIIHSSTRLVLFTKLRQSLVVSWPLICWTFSV